MAADQRYCLECGARRAGMSSVLLGGPPKATPAAAPGAPRPPAGGGGSAQRTNTLTLLAGVGVLLLAMGVGVLIGRSGSSRPTPAPAQVITVGSGQGTTAGTTPAAESFQSDWPAGRTGFTVKLQTLPSTGTVAAVQAAKAAASAKGAKNVGALKSEEFSSLAPGSYIVYSGDYRKKAEAQKALGALRRSFPGASVIDVSNHAPASGSGSESVSPTPGGSGGSLNNPAPPSVLESKPKKGQSFEQKSRNLPNVISTG